MKKYNRILVFVFIIMIFSCGRGKIQIGLSETLTGATSISTFHVRNAVVLFFDIVNENGGISGSLVELVEKDDRFDQAEAVRVDKELVNEGVKVIIGHSSSTMTSAALKYINTTDTVLITSGALAGSLSNLDDNLLRVNIFLDKRAPYYAEMIRDKFNVKKIIIIYDHSNPVFSKSTSDFFVPEYEKLGGIVSKEIIFNSKEKFPLEVIMTQINELKAEIGGIYIVSNALHSALLCQHIRNMDPELALVVSEWGFSSPDFVMNAGFAAEGVISLGTFDGNSIEEDFITFEKLYEDRYQEKVSAFSVVG